MPCTPCLQAPEAEHEAAVASSLPEVAGAGLSEVLEPGLLREVLGLEAETAVAVMANQQQRRQQHPQQQRAQQ